VCFLLFGSDDRGEPDVAFTGKMRRVPLDDLKNLSKGNAISDVSHAHFL
jgi:hypothetical protein